MGTWSRDLYNATQNPTDYKMSSQTATIAGSVVLRSPGSGAGEINIATTTAALNAFGCALDVGTYSTTQGATEGIIRLSSTNPFAVWKFRVSGTSVKGAALATAAPAQILTNTTASAGGTVITAAEVSTVDMDGGLVFGRTGANAGVNRILVTHSDNTSETVTVPFPNAIAVGDTFVRVPYSKQAIAVQMVATSIDEADGSIAFGTGIPFNVEEVVYDQPNDQVYVYGTLRTHFHNSLA